VLTNRRADGGNTGHAAGAQLIAGQSISGGASRGDYQALCAPREAK
jgi:hypothetical protein